MDISKPTPEIAAWRNRWQKNRDFVNGEEAVKARGEFYLPRARPDDSDAEYLAHVDRTGFFPAAFKIAQGWQGLVFRKRPDLNSTSARVRLLSQLASKDGRTLDDLAEWVVRETMTTNFTGLLVDHPARTDFPKNMSAADELRLGFRPTVARYTAESILEVTKGIVGNRVQLVSVRLLDDPEASSVRHLLINDAGHYEVRVYRKADGTGEEHGLVSTDIPIRDGQPLTEIPFQLINTDDAIVPTPSLLQHCVDLNLQHYRLEGSLAAAINLTSAPIITISGYEPELDDKGNEIIPEFSVVPGAVWMIRAPKDKTGTQGVNVEWNVYEPKGQELVINKMRDIKDALSAIGHSILAPEKPAPEAAETQLIRRAAENAMLANFTLKVGNLLEAAWKQWAAWVDPANSNLAYQLNLDFVPQPMPDTTATMLSTLVDKGQLSLATFHEALEQGELLPRGFDAEQEKARIELEQGDRPPVD